ncbi:MAG TPA: methyltransferase domain-containing protein, partial [Gemmatimonadaceae bacterium]|nr:methyltransferase domain-containing protein [Gemmatimonadaceae bacterium]
LTLDLLERVGEAPFDLVVVTERLDEMSDAAAVLRAAYAALRPGGRVVCGAPSIGYLRSALALSRVATRRLGGETVRWSRRGLERLFADAGFANVQFRGAGAVPLFPSTLVVAGERPLAGWTSSASSAFVA